MIKASSKLVLLVFSLSLTACSTMPSLTYFQTSNRNVSATPHAGEKQQGNGTFVTNTGDAVPVSNVQESNKPLGGFMAGTMDDIDKSKLSHALDSPLGKSTHWTNGQTGIDYTVVPTEKVTVEGNSLCRRYNVTAVKGDKTKQSSGTACVSTDGNWHSIG